MRVPRLANITRGRRNTHLRTLLLMGNDMTQRVARDELLPAVRACATLRSLETGELLAAAAQAEREVDGRGAHEEEEEEEAAEVPQMRTERRQARSRR